MLILIILNLLLWVLYYTAKLFEIVCSFTCYQRKYNLLKSSLLICHLKMIKMYRKLDRKSPFTHAATWWSSTLESGEWMYVSHSNHVTSSKQADTLICHTTLRMNPVNFLYNPGHMTLWCVEVGSVANAREGSTQEHAWARVCMFIT